MLKLCKCLIRKKTLAANSGHLPRFKSQGKFGYSLHHSTTITVDKNLILLEVKQNQFLLPVLRIDASQNRKVRVTRKNKQTKTKTLLCYKK